MSSFKCTHRAIIVAWIGLAAGLSAPPEARSQPAPGTFADQDSIFIDGQTFTSSPGGGKSDAAATIKDLGSRDRGPGTIIYRSGDRLYILGAPLVLELGAPDKGSIRLRNFLQSVMRDGAPITKLRSASLAPDS